MTDEMKTGYVTSTGDVVTPEGVASFVYAFEPQKPNAQNQLKAPKYSCTVLFPADADFTHLKKIAGDALNAMFGAQMSDPEFTSKLRNPFRDQGEKSFDGYVKGNKFIIATSDEQHRPMVIDGNRADIKEPRHLYSGAKIRLVVNAYAYNKAGNKGVAFGLMGIQKIGDGTPLTGGSVVSADTFSPVVGAGASAPASGAASVFD